VRFWERTKSWHCAHTKLVGRVVDFWVAFSDVVIIVRRLIRPIGQGGTTATVRFEGITITGGNFTGSSGTGAAIAEGSMTNTSSHYGIEVMNNDAAGILSAKGTFDRVEFTNNTLDSRALGVIGAAMKARNEVEVMQSYIHGTQGNGLWYDNFCEDSPTATYPNGFWVHDNLVVNNGRASIRGGRRVHRGRGTHGGQPGARQLSQRTARWHFGA
jgi:hypothetical protein